jgi:hypothetical protein
MSRRVFEQSAVCAIGLLLLATPAAQGSSLPPLAGCYERVYDKAHLAAHKGQIVVRARLAVEAGEFENKPGEAHPMIASATFILWVRGAEHNFQSFGACWAEGDGLMCNGSLSAAETDVCKTKADGVHDCRIYWPDAAGSFRIAPRPGAVVVSIPGRLELPVPDSDDGPYLYLSHGNKENNAFKLNKVAASVCK